MAEQSTQGPKFRTSCDRCQASKVKCSRNKPSCWRCAQAGLPCVYGPFRRIGRPRKQPAVRASSPAPSPSQSPAAAEERCDGQRQPPGRNPKKRATENEAESHVGETGDAAPGYADLGGHIDVDDLFLFAGELPAEDVEMAHSAVDGNHLGLPSGSRLAGPPTLDAMLGPEAVSSDSWDAPDFGDLGSHVRNSRILRRPHDSVPSNAQPSPLYSTSSTDTFWPAGNEIPSSALEACAIPGSANINSTQGLYSFDWLGTIDTDAIPQPPSPTPSPSSTTEPRRLPFWLGPRRTTSSMSEAGTRLSHTRSTGGTCNTIHSAAASGHTTPPTTPCTGNCYATLSAQLASLGAPDLHVTGATVPTTAADAGAGAGFVTLDTLLSLDCAAQTAQKQTLSCERCMGGAHCQTTLLLLAMAAEKLVGLFEAWVESPDSILLTGGQESESSSISSDGGASGGGGRPEPRRRAGDTTGKTILLAGCFAVEDKNVKGEFLKRLLTLKIERLGNMVIELDRRVKKGSNSKGVESKVAAEMLHDVGRRIFFLQGRLALSAHPILSKH